DDFPATEPLLERNVVVARAAEVRVGRGRRARGHELVAGLAGRLAAAAEELHGVGDDLHRLPLGAVLRLPFAPLEPAVDRDRAALREVLRAVLALVPPDRDVEVVRLLGPLAGRAVLAARVDGEAEAADRRAARRVPQLGVAREVADEHDAIDVCHCFFAPSRSVGDRDYSAVPSVSSAGVDTAATGAGAFVWPPFTRLTARWRTTPSVILRTREISASVSGEAVKRSRWYTPSPRWPIS